VITVLTLSPLAAADEFQNYDPACDGDPLYVISPFPTEAGHWAAGRVSPDPGAGMEVTSVTYSLNIDAPAFGCRAITHRVRLFTGAEGVAPSVKPKSYVEFSVAASSLSDPDGDGDTSHTLTLATPLVVPAGQTLWVMVEQMYTQKGVSCVAVCTTAPATPTQSYWSNSASPLYAWSDFASYTPDLGELMVKASGTSL
jgi:hypothetical protein